MTLTTLSLLFYSFFKFPIMPVLWFYGMKFGEKESLVKSCFLYFEKVEIDLLYILEL